MSKRNEMRGYKLTTFRVLTCAEPMSPATMQCPDDVVPIARAIYARECDADVEQFAVIALDARSRVIGSKVIARGTATACLVHPREVFRAAIVLKAVQILLVHNHPSGDPSPSEEDLVMTERLIEAGRILGIPVVDHIILGARSHRSIGGDSRPDKPSRGNRSGVTS
jgi:DNA repair protein RadC